MSKERVRPVAQENSRLADVPTRDRSDDDTGDLDDVSLGPPRWVKLVVIVTLVLVVLFAVVHLTRGGGHGRHLPSGARGDHTPRATILVDGVGHA